jgi:hypothetical protein
MKGKMLGSWCLIGRVKNVLRIFWTVLVFGGMLSPAWAVDKDTPAAAATRKKLQTKISVEYKDVSLKDIVEDIKQKVNDATGMELSVYLDNPGGVSQNSTLSYSAKDKTVAEILDGMFKNNDLGYVVISKEYKTYKARYDGWLLIVKGKERGYPEEAGKEPAAKEKDKDKEKRSAEKPKEKPANDKPAAEKKPENTADDPDKAEGDARRQLKYAKTFIEDGKNDLAIKKCKEIIKKYPKTKAAEEAKKFLEKLEP